MMLLGQSDLKPVRSSRHKAIFRLSRLLLRWRELHCSSWRRPTRGHGKDDLQPLIAKFGGARRKVGFV